MKIFYLVVILSRTHFAFILPLLLTFVHLFNCYPTNVRPEYITNIKDGSKLGLCDEDPTKYSSSHTLCTKTNEKAIKQDSLSMKITNNGVKSRRISEMNRRNSETRNKRIFNIVPEAIRYYRFLQLLNRTRSVGHRRMHHIQRIKRRVKSSAKRPLTRRSRQRYILQNLMRISG